MNALERALGAIGAAPEIREAAQRAREAGGSATDAALEAGASEEKLGAALAAALGMEWRERPIPEEQQAAELRRAWPASVALRTQSLPLGFAGGGAPEGERSMAASHDAVARNGHAGPRADGGGDAGAEPGGPARSDEPKVGRSGEDLLLACWDPFDLAAMHEAARAFSGSVGDRSAAPTGARWALAPRGPLQEALRSFYGVGADTFAELLAGRGEDADGAFEDRDEASEIGGGGEEASVARFVNELISEALEQGATDIHVEPRGEGLGVRFRVDGVLRAAPIPDDIARLRGAVIARLKVMAKLDVAERRLPQDGRIHLSNKGESIDVRVAAVPSVEGETLSLRLLGRERFSLDRLGLSADLRGRFEALLAHPHGIVLVTGPTGCGKSTTLYTLLSALDRQAHRVVTIEDPVEHKLDGVNQIAVKPAIGLTFASALRSVLRADPNIIMVGEMRDAETAEIAIRCALTGHLVFSTLHTNDALGAVARLEDMGLEPFLLAGSLRALIAQRLARRLCPECRERRDYAPEELRALGFPEAPEGAQLFRAAEAGCRACRGAGHRGRIALYELARITPALEERIAARAPKAELEQAAREDGFRRMLEYAWDKALAGLLSPEEAAAAAGGLGAMEG